MNPHPVPIKPNPCSNSCAPNSSAEALNRDCFCLAVDPRELHKELEAVLGAHGVPVSLADSHPHLFSALPFYVSSQHITQTAEVVAAIEEVVAASDYQSTVMSWAPAIAQFDPGSPGGLLGLDFHLGISGPRLIEINTNPGGVLLNAILGQAQHACMPDLTVPPNDSEHVEEAVLQAVLTEWQLQRGSIPLRFIAIVDEAPKRQYLYPEFVLFRELFLRHGYSAEICGPEELSRKENRLWLRDHPVDFVYNRLTDFALQQTASEVLRAAYLSAEVALSPHPRSHALYADKRNLSVLGNRDLLQAFGASQAAIDILMAAIPLTQLLTPENREAMWGNRRRLFFKPAAGFGSKASYRGDKLTRRVWEEIAAGAYVAQEIVAPSERHVASGADPLKVDIRCYAYRGKVLLYAARMYQGQTTNFRTVGGGFAPVLTSREGRVQD
ncbi:MAG: hypothetical protein A3E01_18690 [Gammaproteobacteria bacterium RIFCSPHIGHO2_12_FULL_63_22]|nr:MAG: hypothetical protein A3E01_18690 [Gammaproteobacteria bacterium RIFCSPHIGHO2_12_FULL_63_22]